MPTGMPRVHPDADARKLTCGSCQWYSAGFQGKTCRVLREVEVETPACIEYTPILPDMFYDLAKDKQLLGIREALRHKRFKIDPNIYTELQSYRIDDEFQNFHYGVQQDLEKIAQVMLKVVALRARVSIIYTSLIDVKHDYEELLAQSALWMYSKYPLMRDLKNDTVRKAAVDRILPEAVEIRKDIEKCMASAKLVDEHLDKNEWALKSVLENGSKMIMSHDPQQRAFR